MRCSGSVTMNVVPVSGVERNSTQPLRCKGIRCPGPGVSSCFRLIGSTPRRSNPVSLDDEDVMPARGEHSSCPAALFQRARRPAPVTAALNCRKIKRHCDLVASVQMFEGRPTTGSPSFVRPPDSTRPHPVEADDACPALGSSTYSHLSPLSLLAATRQKLRQEPDAAIPHVRICAGGAEQSASLPRPTLTFPIRSV